MGTVQQNVWDRLQKRSFLLTSSDLASTGRYVVRGLSLFALGLSVGKCGEIKYVSFILCHL